MKRIIWIFFALLISITVGGCNFSTKREVPDDQIKHDVISRQNITNEIVEWGIFHHPNSETHSDSIEIYYVDNLNGLYENNSFYYVYDSSNDLWTLQTEGIKSWARTEIYYPTVLKQQLEGEYHFRDPGEFSRNPKYNIYVTVKDFNATQGTVFLNIIGETKACFEQDSYYKYDDIETFDCEKTLCSGTYILNGIGGNLGIYKPKSDEIIFNKSYSYELSHGMVSGLSVDLSETEKIPYTYGYYGGEAEGEIGVVAIAFSSSGQISLKTLPLKHALSPDASV